MAEPDALTLPLDCRYCGQPVTVFYERGENLRIETWTCPNEACHRSQRFDMKGRIVDVVARHEPPTE